MSAPVWRKGYIVTSIFWISCSLGLILGQIPGMISAFQKKQDGTNFTENEISLIASTVILFTIAGFGLAAVVNDKIGRRWSFIIFSVMYTLNWIVLYFAESFLMLMMSRLLGGTALGALVIFYLAAAAEYSSPKTRALVLNIVTIVAPTVGTGLGHYLGIILHWRSVAVYGIVLSSFGIVSPYFWVESPHWLATQGRFEESTQSFRKLNTMNPETEKELRIMIKMESNKLERATEANSESTLKKLLLAFKTKYFWKLVYINMTMDIFCTAAGKLIFTTLATVIFEKMTENPDVMLLTMSIDTAMLIGSILSCFLIRVISIRNLLFSTGFTAVACFFGLSVCLYFKTEITSLQWTNVCLLALYFILLHIGPFPVFSVIVSEMYPTDLKLYIIFLTSTLFIGLMVASIMLLPHIVLLVGYHGFFFINSLIMLVSLLLLWNKIPETKGKTLQEVEAYFKVNDFDVDKVLNDEQIKALI